MMPLLLCSCGRSYTWEKFVMDAGRTGVTAPGADNVAEALGTVNDSCYISPNGRMWPVGSSTYAVAADLIAVQPQMSRLKAVVAQSAREMNQTQPDGDLSNWIVDHIMEDVAAAARRRVDVGIINSGGMMLIRVPAGEHSIKFHYTTPGLSAGAAISLLSLGALVLFAIADRKKRSLNRRSFSSTS